MWWQAEVKKVVGPKAIEGKIGECIIADAIAQGKLPTASLAIFVLLHSLLPGSVSLFGHTRCAARVGLHCACSDHHHVAPMLL